MDGRTLGIGKGIGIAAAALLLSVSCSLRERVPGDILLVTIDTLRADRWGCLGDPLARTPSLDRLARGGTLAFEGRAPTPLTLPSHTSMMTGLPPVVHGVRDNGIFRLGPNQGHTLAEELRSLGFVTAAFVSALPLTRASGLDRGFDHYDDRLGRDDDRYGALRERPGARTVNRVNRWMSGEEALADRDWFLWVHLFDPHAPYSAGAPYPSLPGLDPYGAEVAYVDAEVGRLLRSLPEHRDRDLAVVVVSDHGESLGEHGEDTHGVLLHTATIRVPILVRRPSYEPRLLRRVVGAERIAATVLQCAGSVRPLNPGAAPGLDAPEVPVHSESLYAHFNFGWRGLRSWEDEGWRLVVGETERLYHVVEDPAERVDLASREPERVRTMRADLEDAWSEDQAAAFAVTVRELDDDETDALESLGYLSSTGDASTIDRAFREGPDPEDRIRLVELVNLGVTQLAEGHERAAIGVFEEVLGIDPKNRLALEYLGRSYRNLRNLPRARDAFARAVSLGRNPVGVYLDLAVVEIELGNRDAAWRALEDALIVQPSSVPARQAMSEVLVGEGRSEEALSILLEAVELRPRAAKSHLFLGRVYETLGRNEDAVAAWEEAVRLDPSGNDGARAQEALRLFHGSRGGTR